MIRKVMIVLLSVMLASCAKTTTAPTETKEETNILISQTEFTQSEAEGVVRMVVNNHCALDDRACSIHQVRISGNDITASYTYTEASEDQTQETAYIAGVQLKDVRVLSSNHSVVTIREKLFEVPSRLTPESDAAAEEEPVDDKPEEETEESTRILDLPTEEPSDLSASGETVLSETGLKVYQIYINSGTITYTGSFDGEGTFNITAVPFAQNSAVQIVSQSGAGEFSESASLESGWYYVIFSWDSGSYSISWSY